MSIATLSQHLRATLRHGRNRSILTFFFTSLSGRGLGILCQLVQVPLALRYLGKEAFGVWVTLVSISYLITFSDFGLSLGAQNQITEALGVGDQPRARRVFTTTLVFLCLIAGILAAVGLPVFLLLPWERLFKLHDPGLIRAMPGSMAVFLALACLNVPIGLARRLTYAIQQAWLDNIQTLAVSVTSLAAVFLGGHYRLGFQHYVLITWAPSVVIGTALLVCLWSRFAWLRQGADWFDRDALRGLLNLGLLFGVQQVCTLVLFGAPPLLISTLVGAAAIAPYNLVQRIFNVFQTLQNAFLIPLWPAYADAKVKGDWRWMGRTLRRSLLATVGVAVLPMIGISFVARPLIRLWTGTDATLPTGGLVAALLLWNIVVSLQQPLGFFLAGISEVKRNTVYSLLTAALAGALMFLLAPRFGIVGIVLGLVIGNTSFALLGAAYEAWKYFRVLEAKHRAADAPPAPGLLPVIEAGPQSS